MKQYRVTAMVTYMRPARLHQGYAEEYISDRNAIPQVARLSTDKTVPRIETEHTETLLFVAQEKVRATLGIVVAANDIKDALHKAYEQLRLWKYDKAGGDEDAESEIVAVHQLIELAPE